MFHKSDPLRSESVRPEEMCNLEDRRSGSSGSRAVQLCLVSRGGTSIDGGASDSGLISLTRDLDQFPAVNVKGVELRQNNFRQIPDSRLLRASGTSFFREVPGNRDWSLNHLFWSV